MNDILLAERAARPLAEARDFLKLIYQSEFGGGHMIADPAESLKRLEAEISGCEADGRFAGGAFSPVGGGLLRLDLRAVGPLGLRAETVNGLFVHTANGARGSAERLEQKLAVLKCLAGELHIDPAALDAEIETWRRDGFPALGHSPAYRAAYAPAYRLVPQAAEDFLPLFQAIDALLRDSGRARISIDGNSGSGKSTLAALLRDVYGANLYHMDDFFLPPARKTPERLAEPGGNVDRERFFAEILSKLGSPIAYRPYLCKPGELGPEVHTEPRPVEIVEGVYSQHPLLSDAYDLRVFLAVAPDLQRVRILQRSGMEMLKRFEAEWIPLENAYFDALDIRSRCHLAFEIC